jgi:hypothetical protein
MPRSQIKDEKTYQELRSRGESKEKAARIANAAAGSSRSQVSRKGGKNPPYGDWTKDDLLKRAREIGIKGRSSMSKTQLINALRNH